MLSKLLKYEFKATGRIYGGLYLAILAAAALLGAFFRFPALVSDFPIAVVRAARITVSSMPLTMPTSCIPIYSSSSSSSENRSRRLTNKPSLPSRAVMTTRAMASEIS